MVPVLRCVCRPDNFYDWIDPADEDEDALRLRIRWPQVLVRWHELRVTQEELLEILVSNLRAPACERGDRNPKGPLPIGDPSDGRRAPATPGHMTPGDTIHNRRGTQASNLSQRIPVGLTYDHKRTEAHRVHFSPTNVLQETWMSHQTNQHPTGCPHARAASPHCPHYSIGHAPADV